MKKVLIRIYEFVFGCWAEWEAHGFFSDGNDHYEVYRCKKCEELRYKKVC